MLLLIRLYTYVLALLDKGVDQTRREHFQEKDACRSHYKKPDQNVPKEVSLLVVFSVAHDASIKSRRSPSADG